MKKRVRYRPSKGMSIFAGIAMLAMGVFGLFAIPSVGDGVFTVAKLIWCLITFGGGVSQFLMAAGKLHAGGFDVEDASDSGAPSSGTAETRLLELRSLYDRGLIEQAEYESKRAEILKQL